MFVPTLLFQSGHTTVSSATSPLANRSTTTSPKDEENSGSAAKRRKHDAAALSATGDGGAKAGPRDLNSNEPINSFQESSGRPVASHLAAASGFTGVKVGGISGAAVAAVNRPLTAGGAVAPSSVPPSQQSNHRPVFGGRTEMRKKVPLSSANLWKPRQKQAGEQEVVVTDVTSSDVTITVRECGSKEGFFKSATGDGRDGGTAEKPVVVGKKIDVPKKEPQEVAKKVGDVVEKSDDRKDVPQKQLAAVEPPKKQDTSASKPVLKIQEDPSSVKTENTTPAAVALDLAVRNSNDATSSSSSVPDGKTLTSSPSASSAVVNAAATPASSKPSDTQSGQPQVARSEVEGNENGK